MFEHRCGRGGRVRKGIAMVVLAPVAIGVFGFVVMELWNCLMPAIFGLKAIHFWQGLGLLVLARILFGGFHRGHGFRRRDHMFQRWERMTPEEREKFRAGFRGHFCGCDEPEAKV